MRCAVISTDAALRARVTDLLGDGRLDLELAATIANPLASLGRVVADDLRQENVQFVVLDLSDDPALGLRFARFLSDEIRGITFVLTGPDVPPDVLLEAMRVGASEYLRQPFEDADLAAALGRAARRLGSPAGRQPAQDEPGRVYAVYAAKGGAGVTTTAANLAVQLHGVTHGRTLLLDMDLELGNAALLLGLQPRYSLADFVRSLHRMDRNLLDSLVEHHDSGIDVLASPAVPNAGEVLSRDQVRAALAQLRRNYDHVVVDLARIVSPLTLATIERADHVLFLTTADLPSLRNAKKVLPLLQRPASENGQRLHLVVNRFRRDDVIGPRQVQEVLGLEVAGTLEAEDAALLRAANEGAPVALQARSRYARDLKALAEKLTDATNGKKAGGLAGLLPFWGKKENHRG